MNERHKTDIADRIKTRISLNVMFMGVCITSLFFISGFNANLLRENLYLVLQLVSAIPLLFSSVLLMNAATTSTNRGIFIHYSNAFQTIGYAFVTNAIGILVALLTVGWVAHIYFILNIIAPLVYSTLRIKYDHESFYQRARKDIIFILIIIFFGIRVV